MSVVTSIIRKALEEVKSADAQKKIGAAIEAAKKVEEDLIFKARQLEQKLYDHRLSLPVYLGIAFVAGTVVGHWFL